MGTTFYPSPWRCSGNRIDQMAQLATVTGPNQYHKQLILTATIPRVGGQEKKKVHLTQIVSASKQKPESQSPLHQKQHPPPSYSTPPALPVLPTATCTPYSRNMCTLPATGLYCLASSTALWLAAVRQIALLMSLCWQLFLVWNSEVLNLKDSHISFFICFWHKNHRLYVLWNHFNMCQILEIFKTEVLLPPRE
jgi:hypothetical protein